MFLPFFVSNVSQIVPPLSVDDECVANIEDRNVTPNDLQNAPQNKLTYKQVQRYRNLIETIIANPRMSRERIVEKLGMSVPTIRRDLAKLRNSFRIEWVGSSKTGHWEVESLK